MRMRGAGRGNGDAYWVDGGKGWGRGVIGCMRGERQEMAFEGEVWGGTVGRWELIGFSRVVECGECIELKLECDVGNHLMWVKSRYERTVPRIRHLRRLLPCYRRAWRGVFAVDLYDNISGLSENHRRSLLFLIASA
jgi:hypothetical protein